MKQAEIESEALKLPPRARAALAHRLLSSLEELTEDEVEALWVEEAERRDATNGAADRDAAQVFAGVRRRLS